MSDEAPSKRLAYDERGITCRRSKSGKYADGVWKEYTWEIEHRSNDEKWLEFTWDGRKAESYLEELEPDIDSQEAHRRMENEDSDMPENI